VHQASVLTLPHILPPPQDVIGSPYAIVDYHCNSQLGTDEDLRNFHKRLNSLGLYLMLDFVPNVPRTTLS
jgi:glycosidase